MTVKVFIIICCLAAAISADYSPFFRRDYKYISKDGSFYKVHLSSDSDIWEPIMALHACEKEDSILYYPKSDEDIQIINSLLEEIPQNISEILVGIHNGLNIMELSTVDGKPTPLPLLGELIPERFVGSTCVYLNVQNGSYSIESCTPERRINAFVCKRDLEVESRCPTVDKSYFFVETTNKCYKFNTKPMTWSDAMQTCFMEGGTLLVTKNKEEKNRIEAFLRDRQQAEYVFVGFRKLNGGDDYYTVKGEELTEGFYIEYQNNFNQQPLLLCGAYEVNPYQKNSYLETTRSCDEMFPFICELRAK